MTILRFETESPSMPSVIDHYVPQLLRLMKMNCYVFDGSTQNLILNIEARPTGIKALPRALQGARRARLGLSEITYECIKTIVNTVCCYGGMSFPLFLVRVS